MKAASFIKIAFFINKSKRDLEVEVCCATVEVLHRTSKWGEVRRLACPLRRFPFAAHRTAGESWYAVPKGETAQAVRR